MKEKEIKEEVIKVPCTASNDSSKKKISYPIKGQYNTNDKIPMIQNRSRIEKPYQKNIKIFKIKPSIDHRQQGQQGQQRDIEINLFSSSEIQPLCANKFLTAEPLDQKAEDCSGNIQNNPMNISDLNFEKIFDNMRIDTYQDNFTQPSTLNFQMDDSNKLKTQFQNGMQMSESNLETDYSNSLITPSQNDFTQISGLNSKIDDNDGWMTPFQSDTMRIYDQNLETYNSNRCMAPFRNSAMYELNFGSNNSNEQMTSFPNNSTQICDSNLEINKSNILITLFQNGATQMSDIDIKTNNNDGWMLPSQNDSTQIDDSNRQPQNNSTKISNLGSNSCNRLMTTFQNDFTQDSIHISNLETNNDRILGTSFQNDFPQVSTQISNLGSNSGSRLMTLFQNDFTQISTLEIDDGNSDILVASLQNDSLCVTLYVYKTKKLCESNRIFSIPNTKLIF
ncbi:hypothetical protein C2G38_2036604 [Gigaspora rosea]|uniref:Uncharacterized protein n=1 Tax=Gigaspora rosea TaxID=44941 RepID=A0A397VCX9_9GLOM|nr:hypothetical protein C2G38_2036604 [Gigaspora rosea]